MLEEGEKTSKIHISGIRYLFSCFQKTNTILTYKGYVALSLIHIIGDGAYERFNFILRSRLAPTLLNTDNKWTWCENVTKLRCVQNQNDCEITEPVTCSEAWA